MVQSLRNRLEELEADETSSQGPDQHACHNDPTVTTEVNHVDRQALSPDQEEHAVDVVTEEYPDQWETTFPSGESGIDQVLGASAPVEKSGHGFSPSELQRLEELKRPIRQMIDQDENSNEDLLAVTPNQTISSSGTEAHCNCDSVVHKTQWFLPLRRVADSLMSTYFSKIHRIYPVLHQGSFRALYDRLWESAGSNSEQKAVNCSGLCKQRKRGLLYAAILHALFALASLFEPGCPRRNAARADEFFSRTQDLNFLDILGDEVDTGLVQLGVLMGFYLQATERFSKCWNVTSLTIGLAQTMGLHLADAQAKKRGFITTHLTQMDYEMRSRVWYGCVVLEREVTMCFGRQLMGPNVGKSPRLPEPIDDDRLSQVVGQWNIQPPEQPSLLESYIQTIKLYDILNKVTTRKEPHSLPSPPSTDYQQSTATTNFQNILDLDALLMEWRKALPEYLHYEPGSPESSCTENSSSDGLPIPRDHLYYQAKRLYLRFDPRAPN
ncbi:Sorbicillinoid biosynthetic cluster transcription factor 2 [Fusarium oxysporum f. sp. raphani]|uniref:Sorbicillinoid biosynthetic cluster transcription factor 2 n=1 Tax=Fusarium oxysporum f. sp. raphani TaxID=96318 RepID=A0A8J5Q8W7_FUSOX|nr:Sorbicillinoid biosynthetic cluster transcription factor 2 [Fusarium oxysporum f. sp. raphani]